MYGNAVQLYSKSPNKAKQRDPFFVALPAPLRSQLSAAASVMSNPMRKRIAKFWIMLLVPCTLMATTVEPLEVFPNSDETESLGVALRFHEGPVCGAANDVYVTVPNIFNGAAYQGASISIVDNGKLLLQSDLPTIETEETIYSNAPFFEATFCLYSSVQNLVSVSLYFTGGDHTTDTITLRNIGAYTK